MFWTGSYSLHLRPPLPGPGHQSNEPFFGSKLFWRLDDHPSLGPFIDLLAYLEPDLCPNNPVLHKNPKTAKKRESPTGGLRGRR